MQQEANRQLEYTRLDRWSNVGYQEIVLEFAAIAATMLDNGNKVSFEELFSDKPLGPPSVNVVLAEDGMTLKFFQSFCPWGPNASSFQHIPGA